MKTCNSCKMIHYAKGLCRKHYEKTISPETKKHYRRNINKNKTAEYNRRFLETHPTYHIEYKRRNKKRIAELAHKRYWREDNVKKREEAKKIRKERREYLKKQLQQLTTK